MYAVERLGSYISRGVYTVSAPFRPFGGAVDIIVVQQQDGSFKSSPWYVKFGNFQGVLKTEEKVVNISVNGMEADFHMYLDHKGEAYFLKDVDEDGEDPIIFSSLSSGDEIDEQSENGGIKKSKSCDFVANPPASGSGQILARTNSRRSRILGYMFGRKSMKKDSKESEEGDAGVARASSLERAEIAADLLEVKWSTNLPTGRPRRDKSSRLSASDKLAQETHRDLQANNDESQGTPLVRDSMDDSCDCSLLQEATGPCNGKIGICSGHSHESSECSNCAVLPDVPFVIPQNQDLEIATSDASLQYTQELLHKTSMGINRFNVGNANFDEREDTSHLKLAEIVGGPGTQHNVKHASDEMNDLLRSCFSEEESETFVVNCQETEKSRVGFDVPDDPYVEMLNFSNGKCEEAVVNANFLCEESKLTSEFNSQPESGAYLAKENVDGGSLGDTASTLRELLKTEMVRGSKEISANADKESIIRGPVSSFDINLDNSDYVEAEILGVTNQENITEGVVVEKDLEIETPDAFWNQSQKVGSCDSCASGISESGLEEPPCKAPGSRVKLMSNQVLGSIEEPDSQGSLDNFIDLVQGVETLVEGNKMNKLHSSDNVGDFEGLRTNNLPGGVANLSRSPSEISEENQIFFSDINDFMPHEMQQKDSISPNPMETGKHLFVAQDVMWRSNNTNESSASSVTLVQECFSKAFEPQLEESNNAFNALCIPRRGNGLDKEIGLITESLPHFDSHINNSEMSDIPKPLSLSLDLGCESMKLGVLRKGFSSSSMPNLTTDHQLLEERSTFEEFQFFEELENLLATTKVEISLCKHTLYKGMGPDAASQAFDAERVNVERFLSLGPAFAKNDELIVRIGGHYYPWDAAEPIILGMVSCGQEQSLVPEGTTAVNRIVETQVVDSSTIVDPSPGSWRIWPFKTSRNMDSVKPAPDGAKVSEVKSVSESTSDEAEDKTELKVNVPKKKVKSFVATSKELASLNLKEGQNTITFVFSTAMRGKKQVDARIYLWKWNTRVVVSDVDGTITRSDVLGQFMPLVGKDWSQTGVAHLFSAIKENGYQFLFLSARAISQAYLTRQFLFNLTQDGKALPDGPVVISPDGLFPSLFREVIRRAPHEFKIACLKDIKELFPPDCNPFYAGFGNRDTDELSYLRVGIPKGKIFIINAKGEVTVNRRIDRKSYNSLHALVDVMFPATSSSEQEEFNSWNYWRMPFPEIRL